MLQQWPIRLCRKTEGKILNIKYHGKTTRYSQIQGKHRKFLDIQNTGRFQGREKSGIEPARVELFRAIPDASIHYRSGIIDNPKSLSNPHSQNLG